MIPSDSSSGVRLPKSRAIPTEGLLNVGVPRFERSGGAWLSTSPLQNISTLEYLFCVSRYLHTFFGIIEFFDKRDR